MLPLVLRCWLCPGGVSFGSWLFIFLVFFVWGAGFFLVFLDGDFGDTFEGRAHSGHEAGVIIWSFAWGESCKECCDHVEGLKVFSYP